MKKTTYLSLICMILLGGCAEEKGSSTDGIAITVHPWIQTRATETEFETGDKIGLSIILGETEPYVENAELIYTGDHFVSEEVKWYSSGKGRFESYYPYMDNPKSSIDIPADQTGDGYAGIDLLFAVAENVQPNESGVSLKFVHGMSRVVVSVDNKSDGKVTGVSIGNTRDKVYINWDNYSVYVKNSTEYGTIKAQCVNENTYRAIIAPQVASLLVTVHLNGGTDISKEFTENTFGKGESYRVNITIDEDTDIDYADLSPEGDIEQWGNGGSVN